MLGLFRPLLPVCLLIGMSFGLKTDDEHVRALEKQWEDATLQKNTAVLEQLMSPDYVLVGMGPNGMHEVPRDLWFKNLAAMQIDAYRTEIKRIRVYGDSAVVNIEGSWKVTLGPSKIDGTFLLTDVWVKRGDRWQAVLRHSTRGSRQ